MIDITQEIFSGCVYPGDTKPTFRRASSLEAGDACTLTDFSMCAHNGTHLDAPAHFIRGGKTIEQMDLTRCAGRCAVRDFAGEVKESDVAGHRGGTAAAARGRVRFRRVRRGCLPGAAAWSASKDSRSGMNRFIASCSALKSPCWKGLSCGTRSRGSIS